MTNINLTQIQEVLNGFSVNGNQVYKNGVKVDLVTRKPEDRAVVILYALSKILSIVGDVTINCDSLAETDSFVNNDFLQSTEDVLEHYGVYLRDDQIMTMHDRRFLLLTCDDLDRVINEKSLQGVIASKGYFSEDIAITHVYVEYEFTSLELETAKTKIKQFKSMPEFQNIVCVNVAIHKLLELESQLIGFNSLQCEDYLELDGSNPIVSRLCRIGAGDTILESDIHSLYEQLCNTPHKTIVLSAASIYQLDSTAEIGVQNMSGTFHISDVLLYTLALVHINTGKYIEFLKYGVPYESRYLQFVSDLMLRKDDFIHERLAAYKMLKVGALYFVKLNQNFHACKLLSKTPGLKYRVCRVDSILSQIAYLSNTQSVVFDSARDDETANIEQTYEFGSTRRISAKEYQIVTSVDNAHLAEVYSESNMSYTDIEVRNIITFAVSYIAQDLGVSENDVTRTMLDSLLYRILRLLEQILYDYQRILHVGNLICFDYCGHTYIGAADFNPQYEVEAYYGCNATKTDPSSAIGYRFNCSTSELIPASVLNETNYNDPFYCLLKSQDPELILSKPIPFSEDETNLLLYALTSNQMTPVDHTTFKSIKNSKYVSASVYNLAHISMHKLSAIACRQTEWKVLCKYFKSFGMRDIPISRAPLSVYGSINTKSIYPITLVGAGGIK